MITLHFQSIGWFIQFPTKGKREVRPGKNELCFFCRCVTTNPLSKLEQKKAEKKLRLLFYLADPKALSNHQPNQSGLLTEAEKEAHSLIFWHLVESRT